MLKKTSFLILPFLILFYSTSVNAAALKAESKNIILYGDVSPKIAKQTLEKMEIYRRLIMTLGGLDPYIDDEEKINKLIVVTGKGLHSQNECDPYVSKDLSILKYSVPDFIKKNKELMKIIYDFGEATIEDGGDGAFYIYLKKNNYKKL